MGLAVADAESRSDDGDVVAALTREILQLRVQLAEAQHHRERAETALAACQQKGERLAQRERSERGYIGWINGVVRNAEMSAGDKIVLLTTRGECEQQAARAGVEITEPVPVFQQRVADRAGVSPQSVGDRQRALERMGALTIQSRTERVGPGGTPRTRNYIALTPQALNAPAQLAYAPDDELKPRRGGKRVPITCLDCGSTRLHEEIRRRIVCEECGHVEEKEPVIRPLNEEENEDPGNKNAPLPPAQNNSPARQIDVSAQTLKTDSPDPRFAGQAWYDPARPDSPLSQALAWACQGDVRQAVLWFGSERLQDRWRDDRPIITLVSSSGPLAPVRFIAWLRATYRAGDLAKLQMVAQVLGIDPTRIDLDRRSGEPVDEQHEERSEQQ